MPEAKVLENLNAVSTAKRLATMVRTTLACHLLLIAHLCVFRSTTQELHDSQFGKREEIHRIKGAKRREEQQEE